MIRLVDVYPAGRVVRGGIEFLYELLAERPQEANISHREMPSIEQHRQFVHRRPYRVWMLIENEEGIRVGAVYLTERNEVGVAILKAHQRRGYALAALQEFLRISDPLPPIPAVRAASFVAHVNPSNEASIRLFECLGGRHIASTYELP